MLLLLYAVVKAPSIGGGEVLNEKIIGVAKLVIGLVDALRSRTREQCVHSP